MEENRILSIREKTNTKLSDIRRELIDLDSDDISIIVTGSYGRLEATSGSDFDYFVMTKSREVDSKAAIKRVAAAIKKFCIKAPSAGGAFNSVTDISDVLSNIGGNDDTNANFTRRILYLVESKCLCGDILYRDTIDKLLFRYVNDDITEHQLALFFLNDVVRLYRTMCVDFENKIFDGGKAWGIRNIKLTFSRKMLYFGGVLIAAETAQKTPMQKRKAMAELINLSPLERIEKIFDGSEKKALSYYSSFLSALDDEKFRKVIEDTDQRRSKHSEEFRALKNDGHHFSLELLSLLRNHYSEYHPIHRCLII